MLNWPNSDFPHCKAKNMITKYTFSQKALHLILDLYFCFKGVKSVIFCLSMIRTAGVSGQKIFSIKNKLTRQK